ncbi:SUMO-interacting motif-containing protein 1 isoform X5 [Gopherus evgoodei]|uniref:SUMO-interacting motif-containing protein 1 isoform X5 n=1 Tax=Gopherus evgoodei TaxID=1825980 RepID=UPI0011CF6605|nr:SUMO-interacting motif-containing protein 1 isoform X5 [Gopherus evgoodei]
MAEAVLLLSDSGSEGGRSPPRRKRRRLPPRGAEVIDLTGEDVCSEAAAQDTFTVIDLTEVEEERPADFPQGGAGTASSMECASPPSLPALVDIKRERKEVADQGLGAPWDGAHEETKERTPEGTAHLQQKIEHGIHHHGGELPQGHPAVPNGLRVLPPLPSKGDCVPCDQEYPAELRDWEDAEGCLHAADENSNPSSSYRHNGGMGLGAATEETLPGRFLFLQYVVQTLEDDFQRNLRLRFLQKSIAKEVLSCDRCFSNVKEVIEWLVAAITGLGFSQPRKQQQKAPCPSSGADCSISSPGPDSAQNDSETGKAEAILPAFLSQKVVLLLQRMLSIAVEVDRSPNCSTNKIADVIFPYLVNIPLRSQREAFLNSMESQLLRCKVLELLFHHSCDMPASLPLSLSKILYFLGRHSLLLQYQDHEVTWVRWDEMLQHLILLLTSYRTVVLEHLRSSLSERMDLIISNAKPQLQANDSITSVDIELHIKNFSSRLLQILGKSLPPQIMDKVCALEALLLTIATT